MFWKKGTKKTARKAKVIGNFEIININLEKCMTPSTPRH